MGYLITDEALVLLKWLDTKSSWLDVGGNIDPAAIIAPTNRPTSIAVPYIYEHKVERPITPPETIVYS